MAQKKKRKASKKPRRRVNVSQMAFIIFGVVIIISMVIALIAPLFG